jgi:hypothetical protein
MTAFLQLHADFAAQRAQLTEELDKATAARAQALQPYQGQVDAIMAEARTALATEYEAVREAKDKLEYVLNDDTYSELRRNLSLAQYDYDTKLAPYQKPIRETMLAGRADAKATSDHLEQVKQARQKVLDAERESDKSNK